MGNPTNAHDALNEALDSSTVRVNIYCQVEGQVVSGDAIPRCLEYVVVWDDDVENFRAEHAERDLHSKGWVYRHNPDKYGYQQWVCPSCLKRGG